MSGWRNLFLICLSTTTFLSFASSCKVTAQTQAGPVCGLVIKKRLAVFGGVPYAEQPVGPLRFKELQPLKPWKNLFNATVQGPVCPQLDRVFGRMTHPVGMSEACIHANIHTPLSALPGESKGQRRRRSTQGLPVLVYIHGGAWQFGSGDPDFYGPEYFAGRDVVLVTFNFRLTFFGFLSLNTPEVPGNQGLRDIITLLRWVKANIQAFGGDPNNVTIMGQSCGGSTAHHIAMSSAAKGLFKRLILASGVGFPSYYTTSPVYAKTAADMFLKQLGIDNSDLNAAYQQLIELPLDTLLTAYDVVQNATGIVTFVPVIESEFQEVTRIIDEDPSNRTLHGGLNGIPILLGFNAKSECYTLQHRIEALNFIQILNQASQYLLSPKLLYSASDNTLAQIAAEVKNRYFGSNNVTFEKYIELCSESLFEYPALKLAQIQSKAGGSNIFLYQFAYEGEFRSVVKGLVLNKFDGVSHFEDLTYIFRSNTVLDRYPPQVTPNDDKMRTSWMDTIINFMTCSRPVCGTNSKQWPAVSSEALANQLISGPGNFKSIPLTQRQTDMMEFYDRIGLVF